MLKQNSNHRVHPTRNLNHRHTHHSLNFDKYAAEGNRFVHAVMTELRTSHDSAARIAKSVLHALRDRMPPIDAIQFAQGLPMAIKGVYFDQYNASDVPVRIRRSSEFLDYICYKDGAAGPIDFPTRQSVEYALRGVFNVLEDYMDAGQIHQVKHIIGHSLTEIIDPQFSRMHTNKRLSRKISPYLQNQPERRSSRKIIFPLHINSIRRRAHGKY